MPADFPVTELWRVLAGERPGRQRDDEITVFDSVGFALEDLAALAYFDEQAARLGLGQPVDLVLRAEDPKDLFGSLRGAAARLAA